MVVRVPDVVGHPAVSAAAAKAVRVVTGSSIMALNNFRFLLLHNIEIYM